MTSPYTAQPPLRIELAWPAKELSPNARIHHMAHYRAKDKAKTDAYWITRAAMGAQWGSSTTAMAHDGVSDIVLRQVAHPPDKRDRDRDNIDHSLKASRDGLAMALQVNDKHFRPTGITWGEKTPGGCIIITVEVQP